MTACSGRSSRPRKKLKGLEEQANQSAVAVQKISAVGEDLKNLGDKISGVGTTLTRP